ncbi:MAG: holo-ACP synthase [Candidatus Omnitrophica bacterium]|nr:holo-ACP synthase [Candidatus Omnitrophota bacterium]
MILGTGVDIIEVRRIKEAVEKYGDSFLQRIFTGKELKHAGARSNLYQHYAGRFASKEAVFKALGDKNLNWKDIQVLNDEEGRPHCTLLNEMQDKVEIHLSISHIKNYAVANAIITKKPRKA